MTASSSDGASGRSQESGTGRFCRMAARRSGIVAPSKGALPVMSSCKMTPSAQMSARASIVRVERICSGDMYLRRSHDVGRLRGVEVDRALGVDHLRDPEVQDLDARAAVRAMHQKEIGGLEIAMHHPEGMRLGQRLGGLEHVIDRRVDRERPVLLEQVLEVRALEILHHHVRRAAGQRGDVEHAHDVLAPDLGGRASLPKKPGDEGRVVRELGEQELDRKALLEVQVLRREDDAHAALTEDGPDAVLVRKHIVGGR